MANGDPNPDPKDSPNSDINDIPASSGGTPMRFLGISAMAVYLILIGFLSIFGLILYAGPTSNPKQIFAWWPLPENDETRLLMIVLLAGALGSLVHGFRSLYWYVGNRKLVRSWSLMYLLMPLLGAATALVFYLVIRGGFFTTNASTKDTSTFGFAALAALVGMFTNEATQKLKKIAETIFTQAEKGKDHVASTPTISKIDPSEGSVKGGDTITITGSGFVSETTVRFGAQPGENPQVSNNGTILKVVTPKADAPGQVTLEVINPGDQKATGAFTYIKEVTSAAPVISKIDLSEGSVKGGDTITITGSGFVSETTVRFGTQPGENPQVSNNGTILKVITPKADAPGQVTLEIINPDDQKATGSFTYTSP